MRASIQLTISSVAWVLPALSTILLFVALTPVASVTQARSKPLDLGRVRVNGLRIGDSISHARTVLAHRRGAWIESGRESLYADADPGFSVTFLDGKVDVVSFGTEMTVGQRLSLRKGDPEASVLRLLGRPNDKTVTSKAVGYVYWGNGVALDIIVSYKEGILFMTLTPHSHNRR